VNIGVMPAALRAAKTTRRPRFVLFIGFQLPLRTISPDFGTSQAGEPSRRNFPVLNEGQELY
jgi:hypothetical protein